MPVTIMYVLTHTSATARPRGSTSAFRPLPHAQIAAIASTTAAARLDWIVKKLRKFAMTVGRWPAYSVSAVSARWMLRVSWAATAERTSAVVAIRTNGQMMSMVERFAMPPP